MNGYVTLISNICFLVKVLFIFVIATANMSNGMLMKFKMVCKSLLD